MMTVKYLKADFYRMFRAPNFYIAAVSIFVIYLISTLQNFGGTNVAEMFWVVKFYSLIICIFAGAVLHLRTVCSKMRNTDSVMQSYCGEIVRHMCVQK